MMKVNLYLQVVAAIVALVVPATVGAADEYHMQGGEYLFVAGVEFRSMVLERKAGGTELHLNGVCVVRPIRPAPVEGNAVPGLSQGDTLYSRLSTVYDELDVTAQRASIIEYQNKVSEVFESIAEVCRSYQTGILALEEARGLVRRISKADDLGKYFVKAELSELGHLIWQPITAPHPSTIVFTDTDRESFGKRDMESAADRFVKFFEPNDEFRMLIVTSRGGLAYVSGRDVPAIAEQIRHMIDTGGYRQGPESERKLRRWLRVN